MQFLAVWIAIFSVANTAVLSTNSDDPDLANLFLPDSPALSGSLSLNPTTLADEPSLPNANVEKNLDMPESLIFNSKIAQQPGANSVEEPSIIDPSIADTMAQTSTDDFYKICPSDTTGQKQKKRQQCVNIFHFLLRPELPAVNQAERTLEEKKKDKLSFDDKGYMYREFGVVDGTPNEKVVPYILEARKWCAEEHGRDEFGVTIFGSPLCCLGPQEFISVPTLGFPMVRRQSVLIINVFNCLGFVLGRPFCVRPPATWYCCIGLSPVFTDWGFKGLTCLPLEADR